MDGKDGAARPEEKRFIDVTDMQVMDRGRCRGRDKEKEKQISIDSKYLNCMMMYVCMLKPHVHKTFKMKWVYSKY